MLAKYQFLVYIQFTKFWNTFDDNNSTVVSSLGRIFSYDEDKNFQISNIIIRSIEKS
jgi:hypothetical protein